VGERPRDTDAERLALAAFCAALPGLRHRAASGFWEDTLDMHVTEVAEGGSAVDACRELSLEFDDTSRTSYGGTTRGGEPGIDGAATNWLPKPVLHGDYRCPLRRCARRDRRDERGRPPRCALSGDQMRFVPTESV
jgi:hypothetical protein